MGGICLTGFSRPHFIRKERDFQCLATQLINFLVSPLWR
nr:MAG TPA: hypothetical protein [Caudoviricetes sp.]